VGAQVIAHRIGGPVGVIEQPPRRIRGSVPGLLGQRPPVLPLGRRQQPPQIHPGPRPRLPAANRGPIPASTFKRLALRYDRTAATITALARLAITLICARRLPTN
jgi:hypothetical protein